MSEIARVKRGNNNMETAEEFFIWEACAEYADGTSVKKTFPYAENGNYFLENERQQELEEWLIGYHEDCTWYSVVCIAE